MAALGRRRAVAVMLLGAALLLRCYRLEQNPLWQDELYSYQLAKQSPIEILRNSRVESLPPLYYFLLKATTGLAGLHTEWGWRWPSVLLGALTIPACYFAARKHCDIWCAVLGTVLLMTSPVHIFYSQEARAYALPTFVAAVTMILLPRLTAASVTSWQRAAWSLLTLVGLASAYNYLMVMGVQIAYLAWRLRRKQHSLAFVVITGLYAVPFLLLAYSALLQEVNHTAHVAPLNMWHAAQSLLAGYGTPIVQIGLPVLLTGLALMGIWRTIRQPAGFMLYLLLQLILPVWLYFGFVSPVLNIHMPIYQGRQFLVLLPSFFVLIAGGFQQIKDMLGATWGRLATFSLCGMALWMSWGGLEGYWAYHKSPEGEAVLAVRSQLGTEDAIVSLHHAIDAALSFYLPERPVYTKLTLTPEGICGFSSSTSILWGQPIGRVLTDSFATIRQHPRLWVLTCENAGQDIYLALTQGCMHMARWDYSNCQVDLVKRCMP